MHIIIISSKSGGGKSEALSVLADHYAGQVVHSTTINAALLLLMKKVSALSTNTFVDDVRQEDLDKYRRLAKLYPNTYRMYVAGESLV